MTAARTREEILWQHLGDLPYFRAMLRAVEDSFYQGIEFPSPSLDLGCGDGHFASTAIEAGLDVGLDPWAAPLKEAAGRRFYKLAVQSDGSRMPFPNGYFISALSNSVLEHIPHLDAILAELSRVMRPGGLFVFAVPNQRFPQELWGVKFLRTLGAKSLGESYGRNFNRRVSRHFHTDSQAEWHARLEQAGFSIERCWDYFPPAGLHILEWGHLFGLPSLFWRKVTGRWILSRSKANLRIPYRLAIPYMESPHSDQGVCTFYITRRKKAV